MGEDRSSNRDVIGQLVIGVARRWRRLADERLDSYGLSHATSMAVLAVWQLGGEARQGQVAEQAGVEGPSLVRVVDLLVADGLLLRREDAGDRRAKILTLTPKGEERVREILSVLAAIRKELVRDIGDDDLSTAVAVLETIDTKLLAEIDAALPQAVAKPRG